MGCSTTGYTGQNYCDSKSRFGKPTGIMFAIDGHTETAANFLLQSAWEDSIQEEQVFPLKNLKNFEDLSTEATYHDYADGSRKLMEQGNYRFALSYDLNECVKKQLLNFRGFGQGIYLVYGDVIRGRTIDAGINIVPIRAESINIEKASMPAMDAPEMVKVIVDLKSDKDLNEYDYSREMIWDVSDIDGLTEVDITVDSATASSIVVKVSANCGGQEKQISGLGITTTDWTIGTGTITEVAESSSTRGTYTITGTTMAGDVNLASPSVRSDTVMVVSSGAVASGI